MRYGHVIAAAMLVSAGLVAGVILSQPGGARVPASSAQAQEAVGGKADEFAALRAEVDLLKGKVSGQAHAMIDVSYHFGNLWFAAHRGNWPLAEFYFSETRSHLRWAVRIIPVRKDNQGKDVVLGDILEAAENSPLKQLEEAIKARDREKFVTAYQFTLDNCYACHKASDKPYLTLKIPDHPGEQMIDFSPLPPPFPVPAAVNDDPTRKGPNQP